MSGNDVVNELEKGHVIVNREAAFEKSGRCAANISQDLKAETTPELLAHEIGWIWAIYYGAGKKRSHVALIHADGEPIADEIAEKIFQSDPSKAGGLSSLEYLSPFGQD